MELEIEWGIFGSVKVFTIFQGKLVKIELTAWNSHIYDIPLSNTICCIIIYASTNARKRITILSLQSMIPLYSVLKFGGLEFIYNDVILTSLNGMKTSDLKCCVPEIRMKFILLSPVAIFANFPQSDRITISSFKSYASSISLSPYLIWCIQHFLYTYNIVRCMMYQIIL